MSNAHAGRTGDTTISAVIVKELFVEILTEKTVDVVVIPIVGF